MRSGERSVLATLDVRFELATSFDSRLPADDNLGPDGALRAAFL
jgi:hypothetical protein